MANNRQKLKTDFDLPVKRVNGNTLKQKMTDNAYENILPARYLVRDEDRNVIEEPEGLFERVAKNVAQPDEEYMDYDKAWEQYYDLMTNLKFMPNSPTLMNAGTEIQQLSACFVINPEDSMESIFNKSKEAALIHKCHTEDTLVKTDKGLLSVKNLEQGDKVLREDGTEGTVEEVFRYEDSPILSVQLENGIEVEVTPDHELLVDDEWKEAQEIETGEPVEIEMNWFEGETVELEQVQKGANWQQEYSDDEIVEEYQKGKSDYKVAESIGASPSTVQRRRVELGLPANNETGKKRQETGLEEVQELTESGMSRTEIAEKMDISTSTVQRRQNILGIQPANSGVKKVSQPERLDGELAELLGVWVGDGCYHKDGVRFTNQSDELRERISEIVETKFDTSLDFNWDSERNAYEMVVHSHEIKRFWQENFGESKKSSPEAFVPRKIRQSNRKVVKSFLRGLFTADGGVTRDIYPQLRTSSEELARDVQQLLLGIGIPASKRTEKTEHSSIQVHIQSKEGRKQFFEEIGFIGKEFDDELLEETDSRISLEDTQKSSIASVERVENQTTYDIQLQGEPHYLANSITSHNSGGGTGYAFHQLRPKGDKVGSTGGISSGPMSFMEVFDATCGTVKQGGKRRGAQMGIMRVDHPDVLRFITSKRDEDTLTNFNISVGVTHDFVEAVKNDEEYELINPRTGEPFKVSKQTQQFYNSDEEYWPTAEGSDQGRDDNFWRDFADEFPELDEYDIELEEGEDMALPARFIWQTLVDSAWVKGEPGIFYYDETNDKHSFDVEKHPEKKIEATNPCGEQPLMNYEACNLGHINLSLLAEETDDGMAYQWSDFKADHPDYDYDTEEGLRHAARDYIHEAMKMDEFERVAKLGTRFLDNVVTMSDFPLEDIEQTVRDHRKIGLGLMGFAQLMIQFGVRYGSDESVAMAEEIQRLITQFSIEASHELAQERGTFNEWEKSKWANPIEYPEWFETMTGGLDPENFEDGLELRNHNTTTIAPTGTTSMIGNTSGGCEPIFSMAYFKNVGKDIQGDDMLVEFDDYFIRFLEANGHDVEAVKEEAEELMRNNEWEDVSSLGVVPEEAEDLFVSADQVSPEEHVDIQAAFQKYNHSGISKTINFGNDATREDVEDGYLRALDKGIKGITVYRDGSRDVQVKTTRTENKIEEMDTDDLVEEIREHYDSFEEFVDEADVEMSSEKEEVVKSKFEKKERPKMISGTTQEIETGYGDLFVTINKDDDEAFELFANIGKSGGYTESFTEAIGRLSSLALRHGISETEVVEQLQGIRSPRMAWDDGEQVHSIPDGIAKAINRQSDTQAQVDTVNQDVEVGDDKPETRDTNGGNKEVEDIVETGQAPDCPDCGEILEMKEGCLTCPDPSCGYSKCS